MNNTTAIAGEATFVEVGGSALKSLSDLALKVTKVGLSPATAVLALFMPTKVADGTLYSDEDLRNMAVVNTNIRLGFNESGQIYGYHVKGADIPVRHVDQAGDKFVVELETGHTLEWVPMYPEDKDSHLTTSPIPALDSYHIWIHPEHGEAELARANEPYTTPIHDADTKDYILTFPVESGIQPLYVVYQNKIKNLSARFGSSTSTDYKRTFFNAYPETKGNVVVHHAVEQQVQKRYPGLVSDSEMHSLENLRGIPKVINSDVHLSQIRKEWNRFYRQNPNPTQQQLLDKATEIDNKFGTQFVPPVRD